MNFFFLYLICVLYAAYPGLASVTIMDVLTWPSYYFKKKTLLSFEFPSSPVSFPLSSKTTLRSQHTTVVSRFSILILFARIMKVDILDSLIPTDLRFYYHTHLHISTLSISLFYVSGTQLDQFLAPDVSFSLLTTPTSHTCCSHV